VSREKGLAPISIAAFVVVMALLLSVLIHRRSMRSDSASAVSGTLVRVTFEGPWAFAADPDDANSIYAIAPKTEMHSDLQLRVPATESAAALEYAGPGVIKLAPALDAGLYEVLLKANRVPRKDAEIDPTILQTSIGADGVQHALQQHLQRYAVRLPRPDAYVAGEGSRMRVGPVYPPGPATESNYAVSVSLHYTAKLDGFTFIGKPDHGVPLAPTAVKSAKLSFVIEPLPGQMADECEVHNRQAFRDLVRLVNLKLFVDFSTFGTSDCHAIDPQLVVAK
jgi:hypothetical protein